MGPGSYLFASSVIAALAVSACGGEANVEGAGADDESPIVSATPEGPASVRMGWGGGNCAGDCSVAIEVQSAGELTLEDARGAERFELAQDELRSLWAVLERSELLQALADPSACHNAPGYARSITVTWPGGLELADDSALSCTAEPSHPYGAVYANLHGLMSEYFVCDADSVSSDRGLCRFQ